MKNELRREVKRKETTETSAAEAMAREAVENLRRHRLSVVMKMKKYRSIWPWLLKYIRKNPYPSPRQELTKQLHASILLGNTYNDVYIGGILYCFCVFVRACLYAYILAPKEESVNHFYTYEKNCTCVKRTILFGLNYLGKFNEKTDIHMNGPIYMLLLLFHIWKIFLYICSICLNSRMTCAIKFRLFLLLI